MNERSLEVSPAWEQLDLAGLTGTLLVVGAPDSGKTTFARYLFRRLESANPEKPPAFLDGDPGQSSLGPPSTLTLSSLLPEEGAFPPPDRTWRYFAGSVSPRGHMLPVLVGAARLVQAAHAAGMDTVVYDTSGMIDPSQGGLALKTAKVNLLQPPVLFAIQREQELEPLLIPLRRSQRLRVVTLHPAPAAHRRDSEQRRAHRSRQYAHYFDRSHILEVEWARLAIFPYPRFSLGRLVALEDRQGFTLGLGIVRHIDRPGRRISLLTPLPGLNGVVALHLGDLALDVNTFRDEQLWR